MEHIKVYDYLVYHFILKVGGIIYRYSIDIILHNTSYVYVFDCVLLLFPSTLQLCKLLRNHFNAFCFDFFFFIKCI